MAFRYREECYGYSHGQSDCSIIAYDGDKKAGYLDIAYHSLEGRKEAYIKMIEVDPSYRGKGVGRGLIQYLANIIPYEAIDWGSTTDDGTKLKAVMDREFGTSYKPVEKDEQPDQFDPKYDDDLDNSRFFADIEAWRKRNGYVDESRNIYPKGGMKMKIKELRQVIREAIERTLEEAGYDQYGENIGDQTAYAEEANALYENHIGFKNLVHKLQGQGHSAASAKKIAYSAGVKKYGKAKMSKAAKAHKPLSDKQALEESPPPGWHGTVAAMKQHHPDKFGDGPGKINPYALANSMANKGEHPHYKDQKSSLHGKPEKKKGEK